MAPRNSFKLWFFTFPQNDTTIADAHAHIEANWPRVAELVISQEDHHTPDEEGCTGKHLHMYVKFAEAVTVDFSLPKWHIGGKSGNYQKMKVAAACLRYVIKDGTYESWGIDPKSRLSKKAVDRRVLYTCTEEELADHVSPHQYAQALNGRRLYRLMTADKVDHDTTRGIWIHGVAGAGKSHAAREFVREKAMDAYFKAQNKWFDGYDGQEIIVLDDLDVSCLNHYLKIWADKYHCTGEVKGGTVPLRHKYFIVTSNYPIEYFCTDRNGIVDVAMKEALTRRFKVKYMPVVYHPPLPMPCLFPPEPVAASPAFIETSEPVFMTPLPGCARNSPDDDLMLNSEL